MGQQGDYVFIVNKDMTADVRQVKIGQTVGGRAQILSGLSAGDTVVTDGQVRLVPGSHVSLGRGF